MWAVPNTRLAHPGAVGLVACLCILACNNHMAAYPSSYVGVGVELTLKDSMPHVVRVIEGGPAAQAGLQAGSTLVSVDGESTRGKGLAVRWWWKCRPPARRPTR